MGEELGWTTSYCLEEEGFPEVLWETLMRFGYVQHPEYRIQEFEEFGTQKCEVYLNIFQTPEHPDWPPWSVQVMGSRRKDAKKLPVQHSYNSAKIMKERLNIWRYDTIQLPT